LKNIFNTLASEDFLNQYPLDFKYAYYFFVVIMNLGGLTWGILAVIYKLSYVAYIPFGYVILSAFNLIYLYKFHNFKIARFLQVFHSILLPFLFQWLLGGFIPTGAVMLWSFLALIALLTFYKAKEVWFWLIFFMVLMLLSLYIDKQSFEITPILLRNTETQRMLFTVNITAIGATMFILARYFIASNREKKRINRTLKEQQQELFLKNREIGEKNEEIMVFSENMLKQNEEIIAINKDLEKQKKIVDLKNEYFLSNINYAKRIQKAILRNENKLSKYFPESFIFYKPKDVVSGDFYWYTQVAPQPIYKESNFQEAKVLEGFTNEKQIIIVGDCTGHGVSGAFMTILGLNLLEDIINKDFVTLPSKILNQLDKRVSNILEKESEGEKISDGMDIAILKVDKTANRVVYSGAKNPIFHISQNHLRSLKASIFPIGGGSQFKQKTAFEDTIIEYKSGDIFYLFSDGFQDQFGGEESRKYMKKRFREFLLKNSSKPMKLQRHLLKKEFTSWKKDKTQTDDVVVLGLKLP